LSKFKYHLFHFRHLLVKRDALGYGLTLSGDQPVFVQTVRPGGAAERSGIRENDVIVKVNGKKVLDASHTDVVNLIQGRKGLELIFEKI
jgi:C-terminal processing protease CtpA/Prc